MAIVKSFTSFKTPPHNIDIIINGRQVFYRSNMEHVAGVLGTANGGTGSSSFIEDSVIIYSNGKLISTDVTRDELNALSGLQIKSGEGESSQPLNMMDLLNGKISTITTSDGTPLDMGKGSSVSLPDFLLKTGGEISGDLTVKKNFKVGNLKIAWDDVTKCVSFSVT